MLLGIRSLLIEATSRYQTVNCLSNADFCANGTTASRSSMPSYHGDYHRAGNSRCTRPAGFDGRVVSPVRHHHAGILAPLHGLVQPGLCGLLALDGVDPGLDRTKGTLPRELRSPLPTFDHSTMASWKRREKEREAEGKVGVGRCVVAWFSGTSKKRLLETRLTLRT